MIKVHYDDDQPELLKQCGGQMYEFIEDFNALTKSAASAVFSASELDALRPDKDHFMVHNIGLGAQEIYGHNKNGDGFPKKACEDRCNTFVTQGAFFREHRNRSKKEAIGSIKSAKFNKEMQRVETILWGDKRKAEEEYEMAKSGKALSFSMSCRVPFDECSCCGHKAKRASLYCDHLKKKMNQWIPEFKKFAFAINDFPTFYDMSRVATPADRVARYLEYRFGEDLQKAASFHGVITGSDWAEFEGVCLPEDNREPFSLVKQAMLARLVEEEAWLRNADNHKQASLKSDFAHAVAASTFHRELTEDELESVKSLRPSTLMYELCKRASIMPFVSFAAYATGSTVQEAKNSDAVKYAACVLVPQVFRMLDKEGDDDQMSELFQEQGKLLSDTDAAKTASVEKTLNDIQRDFSLNPEHVKYRSLHAERAPRESFGKILFRPGLEKEASVLAKAYGHYQLNSLCSMENLRGEDISESQKTLVVGTNNYIYR